MPKPIPTALVAVRAATQFKPGHSGRPKGTRDKLGKKFVEALAADFDAHGESAISAARERDPVGYMKVVASLLPKDVSLNVQSNPLDSMSHDELTKLVEILDKAVVEVGSDPARAEEVLASLPMQGSA